MADLLEYSTGWENKVAPNIFSVIIVPDTTKTTSRINIKALFLDLILN